MRPEKELAGFDRLLPALKEAYQRNRGKAWTAGELGELSGLPEGEVARTLELFAAELELAEVLFGDDVGLVGAIQLASTVLETEPFEAVRARLAAQGPLEAPLRLTHLRVDGYRVLEGLDARLGGLTVLTGEPGSGKSSLLECLALLSFAMGNPLPPGRHRAHLSLGVTSGTGRAFRYAVALGGSEHAPRVTSERFSSVATAAGGDEAPESFAFLDFEHGRGMVRTVRWESSRPHLRAAPHVLPPDVLALREELEPVLGSASSVRAFVAGWRFYPGFDVSRNAVLRRPVPSEPEPLLAADGSNLSAVLFHLMVEWPERWRELEATLREAHPSFQSLSVKPRGGPGTLIGVWREAGVAGELTLADLSDGTLRLLGLAALCLSPRKAPLVGLDGPELGLHPRVLPVLAGLLRRASTETQLLVATQSPALLAGLPPESVALLKRMDGRVLWEPGTGPGGVDGTRS